MNKYVELPLLAPLYSTYHYQGIETAIIANNPTIRNYYLNEAIRLRCSRKFLNGYTSPEITVEKTSWYASPYLEKLSVPTRFTAGHTNSIIRQMLDEGYYVAFNGVDDYYVQGKSFYKERHFLHDGLICGYNQENKTFCIYAYDQNWILQKFWTPQVSFNAGCRAMQKQGVYCTIYALKVKPDQISFSPQTVCSKIKGYLYSSMENYPLDGEGNVYGLVVHEYIAEYVTKLYNGDIPYERMDRRVFRLIWEHKKAMLERIILIEQSLNMDNSISEKYKPLVMEAEAMRMLYASHKIKRRDAVLPVIRNKLLSIMENEKVLLTMLTKKMDEEFKHESMEVP